MNKNTTTIIVIAIAAITIYFITRSNIFQMDYYNTINSETAGDQF